MTTATLDRQPAIIIGVDAHKHTHHAAIITNTGQRIADRQFPASTRGYADLLAWAHDHGQIHAFGVESTGSYAAALARFLLDHRVNVREVNTPHAHTKARVGKDDAIDAEAAARKVLAGEATGIPKRTDSVIESIRFLMLTRDSAVKARTAALVQLQDILVTAPADVRERVPATAKSAATHCRKFRIDRSRLHDPIQAVKLALRTIACRVDALDDEIRDVEHSLAQLVRSTAPTLLSRVWIGTIHAAQLLITAGENIDRFHSEAAFARLCGAAPVPVSSGKTHRMRLHRGGDRQANRALHMIAVVRLRYDDHRLHATQTHGRALQKRRAALPKTVHRQGGLQRSKNRSGIDLTSIGPSQVEAVTGFDLPWTMNITPPCTDNDYARDTETLLERTAAPAPLMPGSGTVSRALQVRPSHAVAGDSDTR